MRIVIQRSLKSSVEIFDKVHSSIDKGMVILVGLTHDDTEEDIDYLVNKVVNLRIFDDSNGVMNQSIKEVNGEILSISQFTLYANTKKGRRPNYIDAMHPSEATHLYDKFNQKLEENNIVVKTGLFGEEMKVNIENDGPVTIIIDSKK